MDDLITGYKPTESLENFELRNFLSLCTDFELRNLNILIGANGSGKSKFLSLFTVWSGSFRAKTFPKDTIYHFYDTTKIQDTYIITDDVVLNADASNLASYLVMLQRNHKAYYQRIVDTIQLIAPYFNSFIICENQEHNIIKWKKNQGDTPLNLQVLSAGTLRFICLVTLLLQPPELLPDTILVDEPELGLHPYAIHILGGIFKQVATEKQLIIATQSIQILNGVGVDDVVIVEQVENESTYKRLKQEDLKGWLEDYTLGELWERNIIGGRP